jgi:MFS family permease
MTAAKEPRDAGRRDLHRWKALYVLCAGALMIVLDSTIVNVALPSIQQDLRFSQSGLVWVVNAYLIAFGGLLLLAGRLGDLLGGRRIFLVGLTIFTAASLACALAQDRGVLIGARFLQGIGGALTLAVILGMIVVLFPVEQERARAIGVYTFVAVAGGTIGLLAGGVLTQATTGTGSSSSTSRSAPPPPSPRVASSRRAQGPDGLEAPISRVPSCSPPG